MIVALERIEKAHEWDVSMKFYAFDIPIPGTACYQLQHCLRSIYSTAAAIPRHRITTSEVRMPWEFRMNLYAFPADLADCSFSTTPPAIAFQSDEAEDATEYH
jgi:hypothetical protein